jgi:hypothetical protein
MIHSPMATHQVTVGQLPAPLHHTRIDLTAVAHAPVLSSAPKLDLSVMLCPSPLAGSRTCQASEPIDRCGRYAVIHI